MSTLDTYAELRIAEGKLLRWDASTEKAACALQARDLEILVALARYRFLTTGQIAELWWPGRGLRAVRRRMTRLFEAGFVERFRPQTLRGAYQWTYCLARNGFRAAQQTGDLPAALKYAPRREAIFDYRYVIHDLQTNEWVLRYRERLGDRLLDWAGPDESRFLPPRRSRDESHMDLASIILRDSGWDAYDVDDEWCRPVQPDAVLSIASGAGDVDVLVEYDRTRRADKNFQKFLRYDTLLNVWWRTTELQHPWLIFVCQDSDHLRRLVLAADRELVGHLSGWTNDGRQQRYFGRDRTLFVVDEGLRGDDVMAIRLPAFPPGHEHRKPPGSVRRMPLPGLGT